MLMLQVSRDRIQFKAVSMLVLVNNILPQTKVKTMLKNCLQAEAVATPVSVLMLENCLVAKAMAMSVSVLLSMNCIEAYCGCAYAFLNAV